MNRCFASTSLTGTHLQRTSGVLDVIGENPQNGFGDDSSWDLTDPDWPHSGHLSNGRRRQATKALRASGLTREVQRLRPTAAREEQRSLEADLKEEHRRRQANALRPERPAAPLVLSEAFEIRSALRLSKMRIPDCWVGLLVGDFQVREQYWLDVYQQRILWTGHIVWFIPVGILSSMFKIPLALLLERHFSAP